MSEEKRLFFEFGSFRIDAEQRILFRGGEPLRLAPKTFDLLLALIENGNRVVGKEELMRRFWADAFVEEANLTVHVSVLRKILGSENGGNGDIETIPKRGYRFVADIKEIAAENQYTEQTSGERNGDEFKKIEQTRIAAEHFETSSERSIENQSEQSTEPKTVSKAETDDAAASRKRFSKTSPGRFLSRPTASALPSGAKFPPTKPL